MDVSKEYTISPLGAAVAQVEDTRLRFVVFLLAGVEFAVEIGKAREIIRVVEMTPMPKAPRFLEGIINLRGQIIPVLDLKKRFDLPRVEAGDDARVVIAEREGQVVGLLVDKVSEVRKIYDTDISAPPESILSIPGEYLAGVAGDKDRPLLILRLEAIFNLEGAKGANTEP